MRPTVRDAPDARGGENDAAGGGRGSVRAGDGKAGGPRRRSRSGLRSLGDRGWQCCRRPARIQAGGTVPRRRRDAAASVGARWAARGAVRVGPNCAGPGSASASNGSRADHPVERATVRDAAAPVVRGRIGRRCGRPRDRGRAGRSCGCRAVQRPVGWRRTRRAFNSPSVRGAANRATEGAPVGGAAPGAADPLQVWRSGCGRSVGGAAGGVLRRP